MLTTEQVGALAGIDREHNPWTQVAHIASRLGLHEPDRHGGRTFWPVAAAVGIAVARALVTENRAWGQSGRSNMTYEQIAPMIAGLIGCFTEGGRPWYLVLADGRNVSITTAADEADAAREAVEWSRGSAVTRIVALGPLFAALDNLAAMKVGS